MPMISPTALGTGSKIQNSGHNDMDCLMSMTMARIILIHGSGSVVTLDSGNTSEPLRGHEMSDRGALIRESGTEILIVDGIISDIQSEGSITSEWEESSDIDLINAEGRCIVPSICRLSHASCMGRGIEVMRFLCASRGMSYSDY